MKQKKTMSSIIAGLGIFLIACGGAESRNPDSEKVANEANEEKIETNSFEKDAEALVKLASQHHYLVAAAAYASDNANQKSLKDLARKIETDHKSLAMEIKEFAGKRNYNIPDSMSNEYSRDMEEMKKLKKGKEFDTEFAEEVVDEHEKAIKILEDCINETKDNDWKAWCEKTLPGFRAHLEDSRKIKDEIASIYK
jgi:putative membrane protein